MPRADRALGGTLQANFQLVITLLYGCTQVALALYGLQRYAMVILSAKARRRPPSPVSLPELPLVTVQLPVHNEIYVVRRLIDAVCGLDYPRDRLDIQVLDDSTDETSTIAEQAAASWRAKGLDVRVLHRAARDGFKAGALAHGLENARGELLAIFDADFVPPADFLRRVVSHFSDPRLGMVQARWGHLNREHSRLTQAQAAFLDSHFLVEHAARAAAGLFFNFNGTAGVWRRQCIEEAGGWQNDTLTEDLDLSYRAQLCGWRFAYLADVEAPAELPVDMNAFKSQQRRWAKGSIQTARKILPRLWASDLAWPVKLEASYLLTSNVAYLLLLLSSLLMLPVMSFPSSADIRLILVLYLAVFLTGTVAVCLFLVCGQRALGRGMAQSLRILPLSLVLGAGLSLNNTRAVLEGTWSRLGRWERTPKYALPSRARGSGLRYRAGGRLSGLAELALAGYFAITAVHAWRHDYPAAVPFLLLLATGFLYVGYGSMRRADERA